MTEEHTFVNRLIHESSPYLLQHAHNPVDWYPWGEEALAASREQDKPILLSIGYSACHWCHVMAHESFENPDIANLMNELFINIKVDREERPDIDGLYMMAVQMMTGHGGWPMTVFLTPDLKPFIGGTYFPPEPRMNMPGFPQVLRAVSSQYQEGRDAVTKNSKIVVEAVQTMTALEPAGDALDGRPVELAFEQLSQTFDDVFGGFGGPPKFPSSMALRLLLRHWKDTGEHRSLQMVRTTLDRMAEGGMYDQLGGGFHRYSVDGQWLIPHFEKMLYDNALLVPTYLEAYQATGHPRYATVARESLDYVLREMTAPTGGFYSTQDADSEGEEGKFFVWTPQEIEAVLGAADAAAFCDTYGVNKHGNFEHGTSALHLSADADPDPKFAAMRQKLFDVREKRIKPGRDEKILAAWNGLMISAMAIGGQVLGDQKYVAAGTAAADFVLNEMRDNGRLLRTHKDGVSKLNAYHEDYAYLTHALVDLYEATFDAAILKWATDLADDMIERFHDPENGGFYFTANDHEKLFHRDKNPYDSATPSANSVAVHALLRLAALAGNAQYQEVAEGTLRLFLAPMMNQPGGFTHMIAALHRHLNPTAQIAVAGDDPAEAVAAIHRSFHPNKVLAVCGADGPNDLTARIVPLLEGKRSTAGETTVFVCRNFTCSEPITDLNQLPEALS